MSVTRGQLRTSIRTEMKIDRKGKIWDDTEINEAITDAIAQISVDNDYKWEELIKSWTNTTVALQQEYTLPTDFVTLDLVRISWNTLTSTNYNELKRIYQSFPLGTSTHYYDKNYKLWLNPIPSSAWLVIDYEYRTSATVMTDDTDNMVFKDNMKRTVVLQASFILFSKFSDNQNLTRARAKETLYEKELWKAKKRNSLWDIGQIHYKTNYNPKMWSSRNNTARRFGIY